jgi:hypothetical protein
MLDYQNPSLPQNPVRLAIITIEMGNARYFVAFASDSLGILPTKT